MNNHQYVVILAGGKGRRLWPESRERLPKQFLDLLHTGKTLIQHTYDRFAAFVPVSHIFVIAWEHYESIVQEQLPDLPSENILCEPFRKDTAPGVTYISMKLLSIDPEANMIIAPSDQLVMDTARFEQVALQALNFSEAHNAFVTIGIQPTFPNTHYGYIQRGAAEVSPNIYKVKTFTEKPPLDMAQTFIASGDFLWNAGIFVWKADNILKEMKTYEPEMYEVFEEERLHFGTPQEREAVSRIYSQCSTLSIDLAVMEKTENVFIIPCAIGWTDLGTWNSVYDELEKDYLGNALNSDKILVVDAAQSIVNIPPHKIAVIQGLDNHIVIDTEDVLLICKRENEDEIKDYMSEVRKKFGAKYF